MSSEILGNEDSICRRLMWKKEFDTSYVAFTSDGAQWLRDNTKIKLIGKPQKILNIDKWTYLTKL